LYQSVFILIIIKLRNAQSVFFITFSIHKHIVTVSTNCHVKTTREINYEYINIARYGRYYNKYWAIL